MIYDQKSLQLLDAHLQGVPKTENKGFEALKELISLVAKFSNQKISELVPQIDEAVKEGSEDKIQALIKNLKAAREIEGILNVSKLAMNTAPNGKK
jgi:hypothetical protein